MHLALEPQEVCITYMQKRSHTYIVQNRTSETWGKKKTKLLTVAALAWPALIKIARACGSQQIYICTH